MSELDYEQALAEYEAILEISPMNVEASLGVVEVYIRTEDFAKAEDIAVKAYETTESTKLQDKITMLNSDKIYNSDGNIVKDSDKIGVYEITEYDENGNIFKITVYSEEDSIQRIREYGADGVLLKESKYNANGDLYLELTYSSKDMIETTLNITYGESNDRSSLIMTDSNGLEIEKILYSEDGDVMEHELVEFDDNGYPVKKLYYKTEDVLERYEIWENNEDGNIVKKSYFESDDVLESYEIYEYYENEMVIILYTVEGIIEKVSGYRYREDEEQILSRGCDYEYKYEYDAEGRLIKEDSGYEIMEIEYDSSGSVEMIKSYDRDGNLLSQYDIGTTIVRTSYSNQSTYVYKYDNKGDIVSYSSTTTDPNWVHWNDIWTFTYDANGNMIKETQYLTSYKHYGTYIYYTYDEEGNVLTEEIEDLCGIGFNGVYYHFYSSERKFNLDELLFVGPYMWLYE